MQRTHQTEVTKTGLLGGDSTAFLEEGKDCKGVGTRRIPRCGEARKGCASTIHLERIKNGLSGMRMSNLGKDIGREGGSGIQRKETNNNFPLRARHLLSFLGRELTGWAVWGWGGDNHRDSSKRGKRIRHPAPCERDGPLRASAQFL